MAWTGNGFGVHNLGEYGHGNSHGGCDGGGVGYGRFYFGDGAGNGGGHAKPHSHHAWGIRHWSQGLAPSITTYKSNDNLGALVYVMGAIHGGAYGD